MRVAGVSVGQSPRARIALFVAVIAGRGVPPLQRLLNSLLGAEFCGVRLPLHLVVAGEPAPAGRVGSQPCGGSRAARSA